VLLALWLPDMASAETVYVSDKIQAGIRAEPSKEGPALKVVSSGAVLEVLERMPGFARVRDADGTEGWIVASVLSEDPPARPQLEGLKSQLITLKAQVDKANAALTQETAKSAELTRRLAETSAQAETAAGQVPALTPAPLMAVTPVPESPPVAPAARPPSAENTWFSLGWSAFSFAMLVVGFFAGMLWLREVNRKKLGGMYLRI
jgi:uncharacterized protein YgiM (DUF1202 family)